MTGKVVVELSSLNSQQIQANNDLNITSEFTPLQVATIMAFGCGLWEVYIIFKKSVLSCVFQKILKHQMLFSILI